MDHGTRDAYPPLNTLKPVAEDVWIVDGPVVRLGTRDLFVHSPTPLVSELRAEIEKIGTPRWIIGPNRIHYWWIPQWRAAFTHADVYLAPRIKDQAGGHIDFDGLPLDHAGGYPWDGDIATLPVTGSFLTEVEFFHRPSRTLVLTDLIENFEPDKLGSVVMRWLTWIGGVLDPDGQMPRDMRLTFRRQNPQLRAAVEKMISRHPERIILAHGRWYDRDGAGELRRAFRSLLDEAEAG